MPACTEGAPVANGSTCGPNQVCNAGACIDCTAGALCASANACASTATFVCATGTPVCTDSTFLTPGAVCGTNQVCSPSGVCTACTQGELCTPTNPCATAGAIQCSTGVAVCTGTSFVAGGTSCGTDQVCTPGGVCVACTPDATCTSTNPCAATATLECGSGNPTCTDRTFVADGTTCGTGQTCYAGACVASRTVTGTRIASYWADAGTTTAAPPNAATSSAMALVPSGAGGWSSIPGTVTAAGDVSIPGVPNGTFWLRFAEPGGAPTFLDTTGATSVDLGYDQLGRSNVVKATSSTLVTFTLSLATGWATSNLDQIQLASSNADFWDRLAQNGTLTNGRRNGTWRDNWFTGNDSGGAQNRIATGDSNTVYHLISRTDATSGRQYVAASSQSTNTTVNIGTAATQTIASRTLNSTGLTNRTLASGTWSLVAFESLRAAMNLPAGGGNHTLVVGASVGTLTANGPVPRNAPPALFSMVVPGPVTANFNLGTGLTYNRVLTTARWNEWRGVDFTGSVGFTATGATTPFTEYASVGRREAMPATSALTPTLTPVQNLSVTATTGLVSPAYGAVAGVGLTPTLTWSAPLTGSPTSYLVEVFRLGVNGALTTSTRVASFVTASNQVAVPTGVLTAGSAHYVRVTARAIASDPWVNAPFRQVVLGAWAATLSGTITP